MTSRDDYSIVIKLTCDGDELNYYYHIFADEYKDKIDVPGYEKGKCPFGLMVKYLQNDDISLDMLENILIDTKDILHESLNETAKEFDLGRFKFGFIDPNFHYWFKNAKVIKDSVKSKLFVFYIDYYPSIEFTPDVMDAVISSFLRPFYYYDYAKEKNTFSFVNHLFFLKSSFVDVGKPLDEDTLFKFLYEVRIVDGPYLVNGNKDVFNCRIAKKRDIPKRFKLYFDDIKVGDCVDIPYKLKKGEESLEFFGYKFDKTERFDTEIQLLIRIYIYGEICDSSDLDTEIMPLAQVADKYDSYNKAGYLNSRYRIWNANFHEWDNVLELFPDLKAQANLRRSMWHYDNIDALIHEERAYNANLRNFLGDDYYLVREKFGVKADRSRIMGYLIFEKIKCKITYTQIIIELLIAWVLAYIDDALNETPNLFDDISIYENVEDILRCLEREFKYQAYNIDNFAVFNDIVDLKYEYSIMAPYFEMGSEFLIDPEDEESRSQRLDLRGLFDEVKLEESKNDRRTLEEILETEDASPAAMRDMILVLDEFVKSNLEAFDAHVDYNHFEPLLDPEFTSKPIELIEDDGYVDLYDIIPKRKLIELMDDKKSNLSFALKKINNLTNESSTFADLVYHDYHMVRKHAFTAMIRSFLLKNVNDYLK
jgi:hypothetical protein